MQASKKKNYPSNVHSVFTPLFQYCIEKLSNHANKPFILHRALYFLLFLILFKREGLQFAFPSALECQLFISFEIGFQNCDFYETENIVKSKWYENWNSLITFPEFAYSFATLKISLDSQTNDCGHFPMDIS